MKAYLPRLPLPREHNALFNRPYPVREYSVYDEVCDDRRCCVSFRGIPALLPIEVEESACDGDRAIAEEEPNISLRVRLPEFEGGQVVGESIIGGVFEVWDRISRGWIWVGKGVYDYRRGSGRQFL